MSLPDWVLLITLPLGVARAMMFVMNDVIIERPRDWVKGKSKWAAKLLECPWCTGLWLSLGAVVLLSWNITDDVAEHLLLAFSISLVIVMIERIIDRTPMLEDRPVHGTLPDHQAEDRNRAEPPDEVVTAFSKAR